VLVDLAQHEDARGVVDLRETVARMRAGGRRLVLPGALVLLAEAERRAGAVDRAEAAATEATGLAEEGSLRFPYEEMINDVRRLGRAADHDSGSDAPPTNSTSSPIRRVDVRTFGSHPEIYVAGAACGVRRLKVIELASYLANHPRPIPRHRIQADLFPEQDRRAGGNYFRQVVHQLRRGTGISLARTADDMIAVEPGVLITSTDTELERLLELVKVQPAALPELISVVQHVNGSYLEASGLRWCDQRRFRLELLLTDALLECAELAHKRGQYEEAERLAECILANDRYAEPAFRLLDRIAVDTNRSDRRALVYARAQSAMAEVGLTPEEIGLDPVGAEW
jgi:DNA-binding SARP family transcriptional activator